MALMFEQSGEHPDLPAAEVLGALEAEAARVTSTIQSPGVLVVEGEGVGPELVPTLASRLALTKRISDLDFVCDIDKIMKRSDDIELHADTFCVRARGVHGLVSGKETKEIERILGRHLAKSGAKVDLEGAKHVVQVVLSDLAYVGRKLEEIDVGPFEARKVRNRPFFSPISLHPKLARSLINLARGPRGGTLLDPFCGTGGILMEAGLIGMKVVGGDREEKMISGSQLNLDSVKVADRLMYHGDMGDLPNWLDGIDPEVRIDAVATDPPYGRAARTYGENRDEIYSRTFVSMGKVLRKGRYMAMTLPDGSLQDHEDIKEVGFELVGHYPYRVHRSLTRNFFVFRRL